MRSFFAALSLILSTNATIRASYQKNIYSSISLSILPRLSYNTLSFQNFNFESKLKLNHFQPILFKNCYFASAVDLNSHAPLYLKNCHNITGTISSSANVIFVFNSTFSQNFVKFDIRGCKNCSFIKSNFSTKSSERVISLKNSQSQIISCNFNNFLNGSINSINSNLSVVNSAFKNIKSDKGAAIYFLGEKLVIDNCLFEQCKSTVGGAVYFLATESIIRKSNFVQNDSPIGKSIFYHYYHESKPILDDCFFTDEIENEVVERNLDKNLRNNDNLVKKLLDIPVPPTRSPAATLSQSPSPSRTPLPSATASKSPTASQSPVATQTPFATPTMVEVVKKNEKYYITAVAIICAAVVVVVIVVVVVVLVKKKKNRIYPKTDSDEAEPQGVSVIVNRIYSNSTKTIQEEA